MPQTVIYVPDPKTKNKYTVVAIDSDQITHLDIEKPAYRDGPSRCKFTIEAKRGAYVMSDYEISASMPPPFCGPDQGIGKPDREVMEEILGVPHKSRFSGKSTTRSPFFSPGGNMPKKTVFNVSIWDVEKQTWVVWEEPIIGSQSNIRAICAKNFDLDVDKLDDYDWSIVPAGHVRTSLEDEE